MDLRTDRIRGIVSQNWIISRPKMHTLYRDLSYVDLLLKAMSIMDACLEGLLLSGWPEDAPEHIIGFCSIKGSNELVKTIIMQVILIK